MSRSKFLYFAKCENCKKDGIGHSKENRIPSFYIKGCMYCHSDKVILERVIRREHHFETDNFINGKPTILCLNTGDKHHKGIYRIYCRHCKLYIKNARRNRMNSDKGKCPICRKDYPSFLTEEYGTEKQTKN